MLAVVNENLKAGQTSTIHRFERAGLGKAPFFFTGNVEEKFISRPDGSTQAAGSCDYCGTGIRYCFGVRSSDGNTFKVGCDCIHKTDDAGLIRQISVAERKLRDAKKEKARIAKSARLQVRADAAKAKLPTVAGTLASQPHPSPYFAAEGRTMLDYVNWCFENRAVEKAAFIVEGA